MEKLTQFSLVQLERVDVGEFEMIKGPERCISHETSQYLESILSDFALSYKPKFDYFFHQFTGSPSLLVRLDMSPPEPTDKKKDLLNKIYEIEQRPAGIGVVTTLDPSFSEVFNAIFANAEQVFQRKAAIKLLPNSPLKADGDMYAFAQNVGLSLISREEHPSHIDENVYWARGYEEDGEEAALYEPYALGPIRDDGNKEYLIAMGLAQRLNGCPLDFTDAFCMKPLKGSQGKDVLIFHPQRKNQAGIFTQSKILQAASQGDFLIQPFIEPGIFGQDEGGKTYYSLYRIFAGFDFQTGGYTVLGGAYIARPNFKLHGARDAINGTIKVDR